MVPMEHCESPMKFKTIGAQNKPGSNKHVIIWAHGWGQSGEAFTPLATALKHLGHHILLDLPGFGDTSPPPAHWGTADYADFAATFIKEHTSGAPVIWIGHSFGCRVGLQLAARHPKLVSALCIIAGAGLKRKRPLYKRLEHKIRVLTFKALKKLIPLGLVNEENLRKRFGSSDYASAGAALRSIFVRVVNEDLSTQALQVNCPTLLIYGTKDSETPPEIGERLHTMIKNSEMVHLEGQDHYSVLNTGRHQVAGLLKRFIEKYESPS